MIENISLFLGVAIFVGLPLTYMVKSIKKVIDKDYIFDIKVVKVKGEKLEFRQDYANHQLPIVKLNFNGNRLNFLLDTGADINIINKDTFNSIKTEDVNVEKAALVTTGSTAVTSEKTILPFKYGNKKFEEPFRIMNMSEPFNYLLDKHQIQIHGVLGTDFFSKYKWSIDFDTMVVWTK